MGGQAVRQAAEAVRNVLREVAAEALGVPAEGVEFHDGKIGHFDATDGDATLAFDEVANRAFFAGRPLIGFGWHRSPHTSWDEETGRGDAYFAFVYGANVAEVEVDTATGKVDIVRVVAVHDVGRAISPDMVRSQIYGGVVMGMGYGILEQFIQEDGVPATRNFDEYLIPTALDVPQIDVDIVENPDSAGPFGAKSIAEPATELAAPAITNAIAHATGRRLHSLPADLETVLLGHPLRRPVYRSAELVAREREAADDDGAEPGGRSCGV
jgi:CO/xanthine dehydrogenase Mo-binding subunit